jgi:hypothetical protein
MKAYFNKKKKATELGIMDLALRDAGEDPINWGRGFHVTLDSMAPEMVSINCMLTGIEAKDGSPVDGVMILAKEMQVADFIRYTNIKVYGDLKKLDPEFIWNEFYLKGNARMEFTCNDLKMDIRKNPEIRTLDQVREYAVKLFLKEEE